MKDEMKYNRYQELLLAGLSKQEIAKELGFSGTRPDKKLLTFIKNYERKEHFKDRIAFDKIDKNFKEEKIELDSPVLKEIFESEENQKILLKLIDKEKREQKLKNLGEAPSLQINEKLLEQSVTRATFRLRAGIKTDFDDYCNKHKHVKKYDILSQALEEFLKKHS